MTYQRRIHLTGCFEVCRIGDVVRAAALCAGVPVDVLVGRRKSFPVVEWRKAAYAVARERTRRSYPTIAHYFGGRDHTTIISGERTADPARIAKIAERLEA